MFTIQNQAKAFARAAERCNEQRFSDLNKVEWLPIPAIICWAFSIELGIKALLAASGQKDTRGHNLKELFCELSDEKQGQLRKRWSEISGQPGSEFDLRLNECAVDFPKFRYIHEEIDKGHKVVGQISFLESLSKATLSLLD